MNFFSYLCQQTEPKNQKWTKKLDYLINSDVKKSLNTKTILKMP